ncbi:MAG: tetraacyldisaccharide 4'-kinase, partial [Deltaproteobacteria bacterium]
SIAILSRGYKRKAKNAWDCVSDGLSVKLDVLEAGDEPWLMASRLKGVPVYVGANRYQTAVEILKRHSVDTLLLDDGFQHWGLDRDFDFVTFDATTFKESRSSQGVGLLPYGKFREPLGHLKRSNCVILTRTDQLNDIEKERLRREIHWVHPNAPMIEANYRPKHILHISSGKQISLDHLVGRRISAFAGIGNPDSFLRVARQFSQVVDFKIYLDHTFYSKKTMEQLLRDAEKKASDLILTTEKDAVRIP